MSRTVIDVFSEHVLFVGHRLKSISAIILFEPISSSMYIDPIVRNLLLWILRSTISARTGVDVSNEQILWLSTINWRVYGRLRLKKNYES